MGRWVTVKAGGRWEGEGHSPVSLTHVPKRQEGQGRHAAPTPLTPQSVQLLPVQNGKQVQLKTTGAEVEHQESHNLRHTADYYVIQQIITSYSRIVVLGQMAFLIGMIIVLFLLYYSGPEQNLVCHNMSCRLNELTEADPDRKGIA